MVEESVNFVTLQRFQSKLKRTALDVVKIVVDPHMPELHLEAEGKTHFSALRS